MDVLLPRSRSVREFASLQKSYLQKRSAAVTILHIDVKSKLCFKPQSLFFQLFPRITAQQKETSNAFVLHQILSR